MRSAHVCALERTGAHPAQGPPRGSERRRDGGRRGVVSGLGYGSVHGCPYEIRQGPAVLPLHRVRLADGEMAGSLRRVPGVGDGRGVRRARRADDRARPGHDVRGPDRPGRRPAGHRPLHRRARARPGSRRGPRPRRRRPGRGRARRREVHPPARRRRQGRLRRAPHPVRHGRGVGQPGPDARRPHQGDRRPSVSRRRDRPVRGPRPLGRRQAQPLDHGLRTDRRLPRDRRRPRRHGPGPRGHAAP